MAIQLHLVTQTVPFAVLAPGGQSGNFWVHFRIISTVKKFSKLWQNPRIRNYVHDNVKIIWNSGFKCYYSSRLLYFPSPK